MIRLCQKEEMDALESVGESFFCMVHQGQDIDVKHFRSFWENAHAHKNGYLLGEFDGDKPVGILGVVIRDGLWSKDKTAAVVCWYSEGKEGMRLLHHAEQIARLSKAKYMIVQHMSGSSTIGKIYQRKGFTPNTVSYKKELSNG